MATTQATTESSRRSLLPLQVPPNLDKGGRTFTLELDLNGERQQQCLGDPPTRIPSSLNRSTNSELYLFPRVVYVIRFCCSRDKSDVVFERPQPRRALLACLWDVE